MSSEKSEAIVMDKAAQAEKSLGAAGRRVAPLKGEAALAGLTPASMDAAEALETDANGYWELPDRPISKTGVYEYLGARLPGAPDPAKMYAVLRSPEELGATEAVESFKLQPWIIGHEMLGPEEEGLTPPENKGVHGVIGEQVYFRGDTLYGNIKGFSQTLREEIEAGKKQLSCGYFHDLEWIDGVWNGQPYQAIQKNIRANHLALVRQGRMGPQVAAADSLQGFDPNLFTASKERAMPDQEMNFDKIVEALRLLGERLERLEGAQKPQGEALPPAKDEGEAKTAPGPEGKTPPAGAPEPEGKAAAGEDTGEADKAGTDGSAGGRSEPGPRSRRSDSSMDAAEVYQIIRKDLAARDKLVTALVRHVGSFDHADMSARDVALYGCKKLGLACASGQEEAALAGYLAGIAAAPGKVFSMDAAGESKSGRSPALDKYLKEEN